MKEDVDFYSVYETRFVAFKDAMKAKLAEGGWRILSTHISVPDNTYMAFLARTATKVEVKPLNLAKALEEQVASEPQPKKKVKRWVNLYRNDDYMSGLDCHGFFFESKKDADRDSEKDGGEGRIACVEIEVEE